MAKLAETANLAVAPNTASMSVSMAVLQKTASSTNNSVVEKPKILEVSSDKREIVTYKATEDTSVQAVADKYGITAQTIKWVNNIKGDKIESGKELTILPVDGIIYSFKKDDKLDDIAKKYQANLDRIISYNGLEKSQPKTDQKIVIPGGVLPENERPDYTAPRRRTINTASTNSKGVYAAVLPSNYSVKAGNRYAFGNCTWYAFNRRPDIGSFWGNATSWAVSARAAGHLVDKNPTVGAIAQWNAYAGGSWGYGHVAIVDAVHSNGEITISEMNYYGAGGGFNKISTRTIPASTVSNFIH